jgi:adenine-specific DNA-methyltransferase
MAGKNLDQELEIKITNDYDASSDVVYYHGDCKDLLRQIPSDSIQLIVTSPPYNMGKEYEMKLEPEVYKEQQKEVIALCVDKLREGGSICWQIGNYVDDGEIMPIDIMLYDIFKQLGLKLRNRIIWHFGHGLHASKRFSGRYETILWFTKGDNYYFNLDSIRVPPKYPAKKYYKGDKYGQYSCNPLGKNPSDVWEIPNVKSNHVEKTIHPAQFPVELIERLVLSMTRKGDWVLDPFMGVGSTAVAAVRHDRKAVGAESVKRYVNIGIQRAKLASLGMLPLRPMGKPIYVPDTNQPEMQNGIKHMLKKLQEMSLEQYTESESNA